MKKLQTLTLWLIAIGTVGSLYADPVVTATSTRDIRNDAFSPTSSIAILGSSTVANGSALNLFGGMGGVEGDDALFADAPIGTTYFVNWRTSAPVQLSSVRVALSDDSPSNNRAISQLRLFSSPDASFANPTLLSNATILSPYSAAYGGSNIAVSDQFSPVTAQFFRIEFVNASVLGPRIVEVDGNVAAPNTTSPRTDGVFLSRGGVITSIALAGQTIPGVGTLSRFFDGPAFNNNSTVAFVNTGITGGSVTGAVFMKKVSGPLEVIAKTGDAAPVPGGGVFAAVGIPFDDMVLNNNDDLAFIAVYTQDNGATFKMGIFLKPNGQPPTAVVLNGDVLPGTGGGVMCATTFQNDPTNPPTPPDRGSLDGPWMNDSRVVVFKTDAICGAAGNFGESAFARRPGMPIEQVVLIGELAPAPIGGTIESVEPGRPAINNANTFAFHSTVPTDGNPDREVIFTKILGTPPIAQIKTGDPAPRTSGTFSSMGGPAINQSGSLAFHADVTGDPNVTQGFFMALGGVVQAIALEGDTMPGTGGAQFCNDIEEGSISDDGRVVFMNESTDGSCPPFGIFATSPASVTPIALEGQAVPGTDGGVFGFGCIFRDCVGSNPTVFDEPSINTSGDVVFIAAVILPPRPQLLNISTRMRVQTGDNAMIGGFIITGIDPKKVIIRGIGPSLAQFFPGFLADPTLELFQGNTLLTMNDNWRTDQQAEIEASGIAPTNDFESAIVRTLTPGSYTAILRGKNNTTGIGVVEAYDLDRAANSRLANISTRGFVETGDNVMIGGLIIGPTGKGSARVVVRAIGPTLSNFGIPGALQDPTLDLVNSNGVIIRSNNNWRESQEAEIVATGLQPSDDRESTLVQTIAPGNYTAIVRGVGNTTGVALVEVYHLR